MNIDLGALLKQIWTVIKTDEAKVVLPALAKFLTSVAGNPTAINFTAASAQLQVDIIAAQPNIAQDVLAQVAAIVQEAAQSLVTPAAAK